MNDEFVSTLYERIQLSVEEATDGWKTDFRNRTFIHNVVAMGLPGALSKEVVTKLVETCLWASLEREEGAFSPFSVALEPPNPDEFNSHYALDKDIDFTPTNLTKLATALDPNNYHIGVWFRQDGRLMIWGFKPKLLWFLSVNSISPGKISMSCTSDINASFKCLISLPQIGFVNPFSIKSNPIAGWLAEERVLVSIHKSGDLNNVFSRMFQQGPGGIVLLVGEDKSSWKRSIEQPILYQTASYIDGYKYPTLADKYEVVGEFESKIRSGNSDPDERERVRDKLILALERGKKSLEDIYNLTKVDGATILSQNLKIFGFGAKIVSQTGLQKISITEPFEGSSSDVVEFAKWNVGMRHKSAAKFVYEQRDCLAVVVSEDRRMSVFSWDVERDTVQQLKNFELMILG
jgi:hypothetical protein